MFMSVFLLIDCDKKEKPVKMKIIFPKSPIFTTARISPFLTMLSWAAPALTMVSLQTAPPQMCMNTVSKGCVRQRCLDIQSKGFLCYNTTNIV